MSQTQVLTIGVTILVAGLGVAGPAVKAGPHDQPGAGVSPGREPPYGPVAMPSAVWRAFRQSLPRKEIGMLVIMAVGDVMLGSTWPDARHLPPDDGASTLSEVSPILSAGDLTFGNLEGPLTDGGTTTKCRESGPNCYVFRVPTRYGKYLKEAGFGLMNLANNHAMDFGAEGLRSSKRTLDHYGIAHCGGSDDVAHLEVKGKRISVLAFSPYETQHNLNELNAVRKDVAEAASEADLVIVTMHGGGEGSRFKHVAKKGEEFLGEKRGDLRKFAHAAIDSGAALVVGHGPHVVRGMEVYRDHLIAYSLGNFATCGGFNLSGPLSLTLVLEVHLSSDGRFVGGLIHPVKQVKPCGVYLDREGAIIPMVRRLSREDFGATAVKVSDDGTLSPP